MAKYIVYDIDDDGTPITCLNSAINTVNMGQYVISVVGVGNPYWTFETLPSAILLADQIGADYTGASICSSNTAENWDNVRDQWASPAPTGSANNGTNKVWVVA